MLSGLAVCSLTQIQIYIENSLLDRKICLIIVTTCKKLDHQFIQGYNVYIPSMLILTTVYYVYL